MVRLSPLTIGDLRPVAATRHVAAMEALYRAPSWLIVTASCFTTLTLLAAGGGIWLARYGPSSGLERIADTRADERSTVQPAPRVFPPWVEVPHLADPDAGDAPGARVLAGARLPSTRLPPSQAMEPEATLGGSPVSPSPAEAPVPRLAGPAMHEAVLVPPEVVATLSPAEPVRRAWTPVLPRPSVRPVVEVRRAAEPHRDADQTSGLAGLPKRGALPAAADLGSASGSAIRRDRTSAQARIDAGAAVRASIRRPRPEPGGPSRAPDGSAAPWTLPSVLAPTP